MILAAGEALIDFFGNRSNGRQMFEPVPGGSPLNVALGLARLGQAQTFLTKLSTDYFGVELADFIAREKIDSRYILRTAAPSTLSFIALGADGVPVYAFYGDAAADRLITDADLPASLPAEITCLHFGSFSLSVEPTGTTLHHLMRREAATRVIALDPNLRPTLIADKAAFAARLDDMRRLADIVKVSTEDLAKRMAEAWSLDGPAVVIVTDGGNGAVAAIGGVSISVPAIPITVVDTVGAGDTFQAATLARLSELGFLTKDKIRSVDLSVMAEVVGFAVAAAAITCTRRGADLPVRAEVEAFRAAHG